MDFIDHRSTANFIFSLSATDEKFRIKSDGNVGIGVSNPSTKLEVDGVITTAGLTTTADINFGDNDKAIFGAGSDLQIYHDGANSYISDAGTGLFQLRTNGSRIEMVGQSGSEYMARFEQDGAVKLYYDNSLKLATTATGIDVTGTATMDGLNIEGAGAGLANFYRASANANFSAITFKDTTNTNINAKIGWNANELRLDGTNSVRLVTDAKNRLLVSSGGDISFYEDTGTTAKFFWDASAESLGIGTTTPFDSSIHATGKIRAGGGVSGGFLFGSTDFDTGMITPADGNLAFTVDNVERMRISSGNVGIGTNSPLQALHVNSGTGNSAAIFESTDSTSQIWIKDSASSSTYQTGIACSGDNLLFNNGGERMRIDSSGQVGIGTSPSKTLDVRTSGGSDSVIRVGSSGHIGINVNVGTIEFYSADSDDAGVKASIANYVTGNQGPGGNVDGNLVFSTTDSDGGGNDSPTERMRIDSSGRVGIGTSSPATKLDVVMGTGNRLLFTTTGSDTFVSSVNEANDAYSNLFINGAVTKLGTGGTERMRIDASGNLLVGKTTTSNATAGAELNASGQIVGTFASGTHILGRNTNDGSILEFQKDGTTVGSIGTVGSDLTISSAATDHSGLRFALNNILPMKNGSIVDAAIDLGQTTGTNYRFKDLYMSGTAYTNALGVGTTSPEAKVDIVDTAADVQLRVYKFDGTNNTRLTLTADDSGAKIHYRDATNGGALRFNNNAGEMARFDASGNVGIGTSSIDYQASNRTVVHIEGSAGALLALEDTGAKSYLFQTGNDLLIENDTSTGSMIFGTNASTERMRIDSSGRVGIGASPSTNVLLHVQGEIGTTNGTASDPTHTFYGDPDTGMFRAAVNTLAMSTAGTERMRLDSSGNLLVGTTLTNPTTGSDEGVALGATGIMLASNANDAALVVNRVSSNGDVVIYKRQGVQVGSVSVSGTNATFNTSSDQRLKENIVDAPSASDDIDAIQVRSFDWKADGSHQKYGMIAQELQTVAPEAVTGDADSDDMMGVDYSKLVPMMLKEIQSLRARVAQLEGEN